jgi:hypothetical protein
MRKSSPDVGIKVAITAEAKRRRCYACDAWIEGASYCPACKDALAHILVPRPHGQRTPESFVAELERRIAFYAQRAPLELPLFEGIPWGRYADEKGRAPVVEPRLKALLSFAS